MDRVIALIVTLALVAPIFASDGCGSYMGKTFFADEGTPPLMFEEKRTDGFYLGQHVGLGEKFQVTSRAPSDNGNDDLTLVTKGGRELHIRCQLFVATMNSAYPSQHIVQSDAEDFTEVKAALQAKKEAEAAQEHRKRQAALARKKEREAQDAEREKELRAYIAQRTARGGVKVGMTESQVVASSWGTPDKRHHTVTAKGDTEQWVYADQFYLYFTNGVLTGIQTDTPDEGYFRVLH